MKKIEERAVLAALELVSSMMVWDHQWKISTSVNVRRDVVVDVELEDGSFRYVVRVRFGIVEGEWRGIEVDFKRNLNWNPELDDRWMAVGPDILPFCGRKPVVSEGW